MNSGDKLTVDMHDTAAGLKVVIHDLTTGQTGSMTASIANGFGHPLYQPNSSTCTDQKYAFHPMYSTSSPDTRVLWAAHSYNVAYSDEIGHFEYCNALNAGQGGSATPELSDPTDATRTATTGGCYNLPVLDGTGHQSSPRSSGAWPRTATSTGRSTRQERGPGVPAQTRAWSRRRSSSRARSSPGREIVVRPTTNRWRSRTTSRASRERTHRRTTTASATCSTRWIQAQARGASLCRTARPSTRSTARRPTRTDRACGRRAAEASLERSTTSEEPPPPSTGPPGQVYPAPGFTTQGIYETFHNTLGNNPCPAPGGKG